MTTETTSLEELVVACAAVTRAETALEDARKAQTAVAGRLGTAILREHGIVPGVTTFSWTTQPNYRGKSTTYYYRVTTTFHGFMARSWKDDSVTPEINVWCEPLTKSGEKHQGKGGTRYRLAEVIRYFEAKS